MGLLSREDTSGSKRSLADSYPKIRDFLRQFRLQFLSLIVAHFSSFVSSREQPKVAVYRSRPVAVLHSLIHLAPLSGAIALLVLHWMKHWLGYTTGDSHFLQFIAKLHAALSIPKESSGIQSHMGDSTHLGSKAFL